MFYSFLENPGLCGPPIERVALSMSDNHPRSAVLLDPHPLWLDAVERLLERIGFTVVGRATTSPTAITLLEQHLPDVLVISLDLGDDRHSGVSFLREVAERFPNVKLIAVSADDDVDLVDAALAAGAVAYVVKTAHADDVAAAIRQSFEHSVYLASGRPVAQGPSAPRRPEPIEDTAGLTRRELEILRLVAEGHSNAHLAKMLWVTEQTVKFHLSNIYRKLDVSNRTEASRWAQVQGLLASSEPIRAVV
jgi:DNA-binding NarL/FixJ family response regulator